VSAKQAKAEASTAEAGRPRAEEIARVAAANLAAVAEAEVARVAAETAAAQQVEAGQASTVQEEEERGRSLARPSERDAKLAQKLGQLQPFIVLFQQECMGQLASFRPI
jgi:hypothetical protein